MGKGRGNKEKRLSNPFSTGGGGAHFESHVQAAFVSLMVTGGFAPCLPCWPIAKIKLQGKYAGYDTDDLIVFAQGPSPDQQRKMLGQIKHTINVTKNDNEFGEVIQSSWNDFNNTKLFVKNADVIALIAGPLSSTDVNDTRTILEWARHSEDATDFFNKVNLANFSSKKKRSKLEAFRSNLDKANSGVRVPDALVFDFLRHFHFLGFDLDIKAGITLSLLHSLIGQYSADRVGQLWDSIVSEVQSANKNAGTISRQSLPEELLIAFKRQAVAIIPAELTVATEVVQRNWSQHAAANELAIANLIGGWREDSEHDIATIEQLAKKPYPSWISSLKDLLHQSDAPVSLKDGKWRVKERKKLWNSLGGRIFDDDLESLKKCAVGVLTERDPRFDLSSDKRYAASIYGKELTRSQELRLGIAEGLALLGNFTDALSNCSLYKRESIAPLTVRQILSGADWVLWGSLNRILPSLAEAAPEEFLGAVERILKPRPGVVDQLFAQENSGGIGGENYLTGLLWGLEALAWDTKYLVKAGVVLADMAARDPGGKWGNRPANSLTTILLPWFPRTTASIEKRQALVETLRQESPDVTWTLLLSLLPNAHQSSMGTHKPEWRPTIPADWPDGASQADYWKQVSFYAGMTVYLANDNIEKLTELSRHLERLPKEPFEKLLERLSSAEMRNRPENERQPLWDELIKFAAKHRKFSHAQWALPPEIVQRIEQVAEQLAPQSRTSFYRRLFNGRDFELYDETENWEEQQKKLEDRRIAAVTEIFTGGGLTAILDLAEVVESPVAVGHALAPIANADIDSALLPSLLIVKNNKLSNLAAGYVWSRRRILDWQWLDTLERSSWSPAQTAEFLSYLPFTMETWKRAAAWLGVMEREYWARAQAVGFQADGDLGYAIDKLIEFDRPNAAINCLWMMAIQKRPIDVPRSIRALLEAVSSAKVSDYMEQHACLELIKALQNNPETDREALFRIEWAYLALLDRHHGVEPKVLEDRLASDANVFCDVIRLLYRSVNQEKSEKEPTAAQQSIATNAWRLLHEWHRPPGTRADGSFSESDFSEWLKKAQQLALDSGHLEVACTHIGHVLFYSPADPQGFWINKAVAAALNDKDADAMRRGYYLESVNSRGAHWVDPSAKPERELAEGYGQKADITENAGFHRFAATLREVAEVYEREAERILSRRD